VSRQEQFPPQFSAPEQEVCEAPPSYEDEPVVGPMVDYNDPAVQQGQAEAFNHYADCDPTMIENGGGGAGGAPNTDTGAEGAGGTGGSETCEAPQPWEETLPPEEEQAQDEEGVCVDPAAEEKAEAEKKGEMTPEEREADKAAKMAEYEKQTPEEKKARWAEKDGKLDEDTWKKIQELKPEQQKQAMLQAGIDRLDYDDPRRAQLEKVQHWMAGKDSVTPGSAPPEGETQNLLTRAGRTGVEGQETKLKESETRCGEVAGQMVGFTKEAGAPGFPQNSYFFAKGVEGDKTATPGSGDIVHLRNEAKGGKPADDNGHASMFMVSSPDGKQWLTFDGGQGPANGDKQKIALSMRQVSYDEKGRQMVSGADMPSANPADNGARAVSRTWDYQKMHEEYLTKKQK
jgi:hypothetical protein